MLAVTLVIAQLAAAPATPGPNTACPDAGSLAARTICADPALHTLAEAADDLARGTMARLGVKSAASSADPGMAPALETAFQTWAATIRDPCGTDARCLLHALVRRLLATAALPDPGAPTPADPLLGTWENGIDVHAFMLPLGGGQIGAAVFSGRTSSHPPCLFFGRGKAGAGGQVVLRRDVPDSHGLTLRVTGGTLRVGDDKESLAARTVACTNGDAAILHGPLRHAPAAEPAAGDCGTARTGITACADPDVRALDRIAAFMQDFLDLPQTTTSTGTGLAALVGDLQSRAQARIACLDTECVRRNLVARTAMLGRQPDPYAPGPVDAAIGFFQDRDDPRGLATVSILRIGPERAAVGMSLGSVFTEQSSVNPASLRACHLSGIGIMAVNGNLVVTPDDAPDARATLQPGRDVIGVGTDAATKAALTAHCRTYVPDGQTPFPSRIARERGR